MAMWWPASDDEAPQVQLMAMETSSFVPSTIRAVGYVATPPRDLSDVMPLEAEEPQEADNAKEPESSDHPSGSVSGVSLPISQISRKCNALEIDCSQFLENVLVKCI